MSNRRQIRHEEHLIQKGVIKWARDIANSYKMRGKWHPLALLHSIPNGEERPLTPVQGPGGKIIKVPLIGKRLKAEGLLAGIPDLHLPWSERGFHSLYLETKDPGGKQGLFDTDRKAGTLSDSQKRIFPMLESAGNCVKIYYTTDQGIKILKWYLRMR